MITYRKLQDARRRRGLRDSGFTLIELIMALVLSGLIAGVVVAALVTSLNIADSTSDQLHDSTDAGLISAFLYRDAQAAGGTDPAKAQLDSSIGVSTTDWGGCSQSPSTLVVRFSWFDRQTVSAKRAIVATYALDATNQLTRRICEDGVPTNVVLGRFLDSATASCLPSCSGLPNTVTLSMSGSGDRAPFSYTLSASLRTQTQIQPTTTNSSTVALVALGGVASTCPNLSLAGTSLITVRGDVAVGADCVGGSAQSGSQTLAPTGTTAVLPGITNPFSALATPAVSCSGSNPAVGTPGTYPTAVTVSSAVVFAAGTYIFCNGITFAAGAVITGTGVFMYLAGGTLTVNTAATIDLSPPSSGTYNNMLAWVATAQTVVLNDGANVSSYRGLIYAPLSQVNVVGSVATNIGGIVAKTVNFSGVGLSTRIGLPIPSIIIAGTPPNGGQGVAYTTTLAASGGTAGYTWSAAGLPAGLSIGAATGVISGTPTVSGTFTFTATTLDSTKAAASRTFTITIAPPLAITCLALANGTKGSTYTSGANITPSGGTSPYSISANWLPSGLSISSSGVISGTPLVAGTFSGTITVTDALGATASCSSSLTIIDVTPPAAQTIQTLISGGIPGRVETGDKIQFAYNDAMNLSSIAPGLNSSTPTNIYMQIADTHGFRGIAKNDVAVLSFFTASTPPTCNTTPYTSTSGTVMLGVVSMGVHKKFLVGGQGSAVFAATFIADSTSKVITVTLGALSCGISEIATSDVTTNMTWYPSAAAIDQSGNPTSTTPALVESDGDLDW